MPLPADAGHVPAIELLTAYSRLSSSTSTHSCAAVESSTPTVPSADCHYGAIRMPVSSLFLALLILISCSALLIALLTSGSGISPVLLYSLFLLLCALCVMLRRASLKLISPSATVSSASPQPPPTSLHRRRRSRRNSRAHPYINSTSPSYTSTSPSPSQQQQLTPDSSSSFSTSVAASGWSKTCNLPLTIQSPTVPQSPQPYDPLQSDDTDAFLALRDGRYQLLRTVQTSLFGCVKLATEQTTGRRVCIKISCLHRAALGVTVNGVKVEEDVQREARLLHYLQAAAPAGETGRDGIVEFVEELKDEQYHYLILADAGCDLFVHLRQLPVLRSQLQYIERVPSINEDAARDLFRQLIDAVQYCHRHHVAVNDLSLENVCIDATGRIRLIDLGLAAIHPLSPHSPSVSSTRLPLPAESPPVDSFFPVVPPQDSGPLSGKLHYMSGEKFSRQPHCAYSADLYACAVILYTLLTGRPPYNRPVPADYWWSIVSSGRWTKLGRGAAVEGLSERERREERVAAELFGWLSEEAVEMLDGMMKEEGQRWSWEQVNACKWLQAGGQA